MTTTETTLLEALKQVRALGYKSDFDKLTDTVLKTTKLAEDAILAAEKYEQEQTTLRAKYLAAAKGNAREGELEIDDNAIVSKGDADGAYVGAWVWVNDSETEMEETEISLYRCQNCESEWTLGQLKHTHGDIPHLAERVAAGELMPAGECPDCGALCHEIEDGESTDDCHETCRVCGETYELGGDGYDGLCPSCADGANEIAESQSLAWDDAVLMFESKRVSK